MIVGQTSRRNGVQDLLCPFTDMIITQGSGFNGGTYSHNGTGAIDVIGIDSGVRYPYYAPCDLVCVKVYPQYAEAHWQSVEPVRYANGTINYITIMTCHDNTLNAYVGMKIPQGVQLGNMGDGGNATGVHCHIEEGYNQQTDVHQNGYGIWCFDNELEFEDAYFMDNTNIIYGFANWKYLKDIPVVEPTPVEPTPTPAEPTPTPSEPTEPITPTPSEPTTDNTNWFIKIIEKVIDFFIALFKKK